MNQIIAYNERMKATGTGQRAYSQMLLIQYVQGPAPVRAPGRPRPPAQGHDFAGRMVVIGPEGDGDDSVAHLLQAYQGYDSVRRARREEGATNVDGTAMEIIETAPQLRSYLARFSSGAGLGVGEDNPGWDAVAQAVAEAVAE